MKNRYEVRGSTTAIFLNRRNGDVLEALIDTADLKIVDRFPYTWCASWSNTTQSFYCYGKARTLNWERVSVFLHKWILSCPSGMQVDHHDNNTLNNRRQNLRVVTRGENHQNRAGAQRNSLTRVRGVSWHRKKRKYQAGLKIKDRRIFLGYFLELTDAQKAVELARKELMPFSKEASNG